jgi:hypothetical protein
MTDFSRNPVDNELIEFSRFADNSVETCLRFGLPDNNLVGTRCLLVLQPTYVYIQSIFDLV